MTRLIEWTEQAFLTIRWYFTTIIRWTAYKTGPPFPPLSPADWRHRPYYGETHCPECGTELVLDDSLKTGKDRKPKHAWWYDEWACPECYYIHRTSYGTHPGVYMDWPEEYEESFARILEEFIAEQKEKEHVGRD